MNKKELRRLLEEAGDARINYKSPKSNKVKYNICTLDFTTPYIQEKGCKAKETEDTLLMFCWDRDSYRLMKAENVLSVIPLADILRNES